MAIRRHAYPLLLAVGLALYIALLTGLDIARFYGLKSNILDIGVFNQIFWLMLHHGHPFATTNHFFPILWAFLPLYALAPHPETLLALNVVLLASAAIPIYLIARHWRIKPGLALLWSVAYLANPFVLSAAMWDFREVAPATAIIGWALYAIACRRLILLSCMLLLLVLCKEHYGLNVAGFGLLWAILHRQWRTGIAISALGLTVFIVILLLVLPALNGHDFMQWSQNASQRQFAWLFHPSSLPGAFFVLLALAAAMYGMTLLIPFWFLPLAAFSWLLPSAGDVAMNAFAQGGYLRSLFACQSVSIIPVLTVATMRGALTLADRRPQLRFGELTWLVAVSSLLFGYINAPLALPGARNVWEIHLRDLSDPERGDIRHIQAMFPPEKNMAVQSNVGGFFSQRAHLSAFQLQLEEADGVILHLDYPFQHLHDMFDAPFLLPAPAYLSAVRGALRDPHWHITYWHNKWLVLERDKPGIAADKAQIGRALTGVESAYRDAVRSSD